MRKSIGRPQSPVGGLGIFGQSGSAPVVRFFRFYQRVCDAIFSHATAMEAYFFGPRTLSYICGLWRHPN
jgi:hypothetical protein